MVNRSHADTARNLIGPTTGVPASTAKLLPSYFYRRHNFIPRQCSRESSRTSGDGVAARCRAVVSHVSLIERQLSAASCQP